MRTLVVPDGLEWVRPAWHTRAGDVVDAYGPATPVATERIALEDMTLMGGVPSEEVLASIERKWAPDVLVAQVAEAYACRKHALWLLESEPLKD